MRMVQVAPPRCKFISVPISCKLWIKQYAPPRFSTLNRVKIQREKLNMHPWRNWQTRMVQVHIFERKCRFNSCRVHHKKLDFIGLFSFFLNLNCWHTHNLGVEISCIFTTNSILLNYAIIIISKSLRSCVCQLILTLQYEIMFHTAFSINFIMFCEFGFEINFYPQLFITLIYLDFIN